MKVAVVGSRNLANIELEQAKSPQEKTESIGKILCSLCFYVYQIRSFQVTQTVPSEPKSLIFFLIASLIASTFFALT